MKNLSKIWLINAQDFYFNFYHLKKYKYSGIIITIAVISRVLYISTSSTVVYYLFIIY